MAPPPPSYADIWGDDHNDVLEAADSVVIAWCKPCNLEWSYVLDASPSYPIPPAVNQHRCPRCGRTDYKVFSY